MVFEFRKRAGFNVLQWFQAQITEYNIIYLCIYTLQFLNILSFNIQIVYDIDCLFNGNWLP